MYGRANFPLSLYPPELITPSVTTDYGTRF